MGKCASPVQVGHHSSAPLLYLALGKGASARPAELVQGFVQPLAAEAGMAPGSTAAQPQHSKVWEQPAGNKARHSLDILVAENMVLREGNKFFIRGSGKRVCAGPAKSQPLRGIKG